MKFIRVVTLLIVLGVLVKLALFGHSANYTSEANGFSIYLPSDMEVRVDKPGIFRAFHKEHNNYTIQVAFKKNADDETVPPEKYALDYIKRFQPAPFADKNVKQTDKTYTAEIMYGEACKMVIAFHELPDGYAAIVVQCPSYMASESRIQNVLESFRLE